MYAWILSNLITPISQDGQFCSYYELLLKATTTLSTNKEPRVSSSVAEPHTPRSHNASL